MADPKLPGIYVIRNTANGKCYVGSAVSIARRWTVHRCDLKAGVHRSKPLQRAYDKHGASAFVYEVLEFVPALTDLIAREQYWLDELQSHCEAHGYNVCPIAESRLGMKMPESAKLRLAEAGRGRTHSAATKALIGLAHKGKIISEAHRIAVSRAHKGKRRTPEEIAKQVASQRALGWKMSDEQKAAVSRVHKGKTLSQAQKDAVRNAHLGKPKSAEVRAKISAAQIGRVKSVEECRNISRGRRAALAKPHPDQLSLF